MADGKGTKDYEILQGDSLLFLPSFDDCLFDSCVCDPPYELGFMGKAWDKSGIAYRVDLWREVYRVLKPGAYLLAFGGSRTYHRMACAIEDAGFEIRDQIQWIYGSGFPKSLDVSKAIDKTAGHWRGKAGVVTTANGAMSGPNYERTSKGDPITAAAAEWQGFGTALKPSHEPICMARKPLGKGLTVAQNVLKWGTGAINIDACRVSTDDILTGSGTPPLSYCGANPRPFHKDAVPLGMNQKPGGRFPANIIHDGSDEVLAGFPETTSGSGNKGGRNETAFFGSGSNYDAFYDGDSGSASRFFYSAKASKYDREAGLDTFDATFSPTMGNGIGGKEHDPETATKKTNHHPTVKPTDLMQYLCRLVTPPGGLILDPFLGSGSTAKAALIERFRIIGIELDPEYAVIAEARCKELQVKLF